MHLENTNMHQWRVMVYMYVKNQQPNNTKNKKKKTSSYQLPVNNNYGQICKAFNHTEMFQASLRQKPHR